MRLQKYCGDVDECAVIDSSDDDETSSAEEIMRLNSLFSEEEGLKWRAAALRNGSGSRRKSNTVGTEETVEKVPGIIKL